MSDSLAVDSVSLSGDKHAGIVFSHELNVGGGQVLADDRPPVVTAGVVPLAVDDRHAGLLAEPAGRRETVRLGQALVAGGRPLVDADHKFSVDRTVGGQHLDQGGGPEPAVDVEGLVVGSLATRHLSIGMK